MSGLDDDPTFSQELREDVFGTCSQVSQDDFFSAIRSQDVSQGSVPVMPMEEDVAPVAVPQIAEEVPQILPDVPPLPLAFEASTKSGRGKKGGKKPVAGFAMPFRGEDAPWRDGSWQRPFSGPVWHSSGLPELPYDEQCFLPQSQGLDEPIPRLLAPSTQQVSDDEWCVFNIFKTTRSELLQGQNFGRMCYVCWEQIREMRQMWNDMHAQAKHVELLPPLREYEVACDAPDVRRIYAEECASYLSWLNQRDQ